MVLQSIYSVTINRDEYKCMPNFLDTCFKSHVTSILGVFFCICSPYGISILYIENYSNNVEKLESFLRGTLRKSDWSWKGRARPWFSGVLGMSEGCGRSQETWLESSMMPSLWNDPTLHFRRSEGPIEGSEGMLIWIWLGKKKRKYTHREHKTNWFSLKINVVHHTLWLKTKRKDLS